MGKLLSLGKQMAITLGPRRMDQAKTKMLPAETMREKIHYL